MILTTKYLEGRVENNLIRCIFFFLTKKYVYFYWQEIWFYWTQDYQS